jgi:hypothetical protein
MPNPTLQLHDARLELDASAGTIAFARGSAALRGIASRATVAIDGADRPIDLLRGGTLALEEHGSARRAVVRVDHGGFSSEWCLTVTAGDPFAAIEAMVVAGGRALTLVELVPLTVPWSGTPLAREVATSRWWIWPACGWDRPGTRPLAGPVHDDDCRSVAFDIGGAYGPSGATLALGHILPSRWINRIDADGERARVTATVKVPVPAHSSLRSDRLLLDAARPIMVALADIGGRHRGRRRPEEVAEHLGWNHWDYYTDKVKESDIDETLAAIAKLPWMKSALRYVIVDDFWQDRTGDWNPGERFGSIERAAKSIAAAGFVPGIWSAPFMMDRQGELLKRHPDAALRLDDGRHYTACMGCDPPWGDRCYLDPTHPAVVDHIHRLYRKLHGWGFRYFKTDFLANSIAPEFPGDSAQYRGHVRYHDPGLGLVRAHRTCMEAIRAAIGPESWWLGCGPHYATGAGLMDSVRMSGDIRPYWTNLLMCARSGIFNFYMHGGPFLLDPDFAIFRGRDTFDRAKMDLLPEGAKPYERAKPDTGPTYSLEEARLWAAVIVMGGGMVTLSDRIDGLDERGLAIARFVLEHGGGQPAQPLDLFSPYPSAWCKRRGRETWLLLANWDDVPRRVAVPEGSGLAEGAELVEQWTQEHTRFRPGYAVELAPHGHRLLRAVSGG